MEIVTERLVSEIQQDSVTVRKAAVEFQRSGVSGVKISVASESPTPVEVELTESIPKTVPMSDIQPHPKFRPHKWHKSAEGRELVYRDAVAPGETVESVYGVRLSFAELEPLLGAPVITRLTPLEEGESPDEPELERATEEKEVTEPPRDQPTVGTENPGAAVTNGTGKVDQGFEFGGPEPLGSKEPTSDSIETPTPDDVETAVESQSPALKLRIETIEANLDRLGAFAESFEEYVADEQATSARIEEIVARQETLVDATEDLSEQLASGDLERGSIQRRLDNHDQELTRVLERTQTTIESLRVDIDDLSSAEAELRQKTDDLTRAAQSGAKELSSVTDQLKEQHNELASLRDKHSAFSRSLEKLEDQSETGAAKRRDLQRDITELNEEITHLEEGLETTIQDLQSTDSALQNDYRSLAEFAESLDSRVSEAEADRSSIAEELTSIRQSIEALQERFDTHLVPLNQRVDELEDTFTAEETQAIQEVIAAERRWLDWQQDL